jgi:hypothetical protein
MDNHPSIEALKATAPHRFSPMPWKPDTAPGDDEPMIRDANGDDVGRFAVAEDRDHTLSATLAAPHLLARVAELEASFEAARVAVDALPFDAHEIDCESLNPDPDCDGWCDCNVMSRIGKVRLALGLDAKP